MTHPIADLIACTRALVDAIKYDEHGVMVGNQLQGGNGGLISRDTLRLADQVEVALGTVERLQGGFTHGEAVRTVKGAAFCGELIGFDYDAARPGCTVRAVHPVFAGTKHVYPLTQIARVPKDEA